MVSRKVLVLGASGMLGNAVFRSLYGRPEYDVLATVRNAASLRYFSEEQRKNFLTDIDVLDSDSLVALLNRAKPDVVINCIGVIKQLSDAKDPLVALPLNSLFPHKLARLAALCGARVIHVSTDCVFSGALGNYTEAHSADATDLYGMSKYLGELVTYSNAVTLRTSIIGRELSSANSLLDWFLSQDGEVKGYAKAIFSGLPTCELAALIADIVIPDESLTGLYHVSAEAISKYDLLRLIAAEYGKAISIVRDDRVEINRSLDSSRFSQATGYVAPAWPDLIKRMHDADYRGAK